MNATSYSSARDKLPALMDQVCANHDPLILTRDRSPAVVMLSLEDYESLQETAHLLRSPANAPRLAEGIEELEAGDSVLKILSEFK
jgi:antitoxin YefM